MLLLTEKKKKSQDNLLMFGCVEIMNNFVFNEIY